MMKYALVMAAALALAAGSAQAGFGYGSSAGGSDGFDNGVQLNGISASGFAVETVELPDGPVLAGGQAGVDPG